MCQAISWPDTGASFKAEFAVFNFVFFVQIKQTRYRVLISDFRGAAGQIL